MRIGAAGAGRRSRNQRQNLCTTEALGHGEEKIKWNLFGPPVHGWIQSQSFDISGFSLQRKNEDTEVSICRRRPASDPKTYFGSYSIPFDTALFSRLGFHSCFL